MSRADLHLRRVLAAMAGPAAQAGLRAATVNSTNLDDWNALMPRRMPGSIQRDIGSCAQRQGRVPPTELARPVRSGTRTAAHPVLHNRFLDYRLLCNQNPMTLIEFDNNSGDLSGGVDRIPMAGQALRRLAAPGVPDG
ncbi:MAG: hypothetical protein IH627_06545 [Rubrivivax sp.]|nr:hypothetical protein [Rubrivivax sp.]